MPDVHLGQVNTGVVFPGGGSKQGPHRLGAAATCLQLEAFGYQLNIRPSVEKDATKIGTLVHVGLAYRYGAMLDKKPDWLVYPDARWAIWICGQDRPDCAAEALRIYDAYVAHYDPLLASGVVPPWKPLLVEHQFEVAFKMPDGSVEPYTTRIDMLVQCGKEIWLVDHKMRLEDLEPQRQALRGRSPDADAARACTQCRLPSESAIYQRDVARVPRAAVRALRGTDLARGVRASRTGHRLGA